MADKEIPLVPTPETPPFGQSVIDLAEVRIRKGLSDVKVGRPCNHHALIYDNKERRVWCENCERTIDNFDAFMTLVSNFHSMVNAASHALRRAKEAEALTINLRAAKVFDKAWRGNQMAVSCPHCRTGLLPEDFLSGGSQTSAEIERARRAKAALQPPTEEGRDND